MADDVSTPFRQEVNVAPLMSADKAVFLRRRLLSTALGGVRTAPGVGVKALIVQGFAWLLPAILIPTLAFLDLEDGIRELIALAVGVSLCLIWELIRKATTLYRGSGDNDQNKAAWFTDYDNAECANILDASFWSTLFPEKRSGLHLLVNLSLAGLTFAVAVEGAVYIGGSNQGLGLSGAPRVVLMVLLSICVSIALFGLWGGRPIEGSLNRYQDPYTLPGYLADFSRPITMGLVLLPLLSNVDLPDNAGRGLLIAALLLPLCWSLCLVPQLDTLLPWAFEQVEKHLFGGSPVPGHGKLVVSVIFSTAATAAIAAAAQLGALIKEDSAIELLVPTAAAYFLASVQCSLPFSTATHTTNLSKGYLRSYFDRCLLGLLQVALGLGLAIPLHIAVETGEVYGSLHWNFRDRSWNFTFMMALRTGFELVLPIIAVLVYVGTSARNLRADGGTLFGICKKRQLKLYRSRRDWLLGKGPGDQAGEEEVRSSRVAHRTAMTYLLLEASLRILLLAYIAIWSTRASFPPGFRHKSFWENAREATPIYWLVRRSICRPLATTFDVGLTFLIYLGLSSAVGGPGESKDFVDSYLALAVAWRVLITSWARGKLDLTRRYFAYASHLARASMLIPKLRHKVVVPLVLCNCIFLPIVGLIFLLTAALDAPLMALLTLPCFFPGYPRAIGGYPEVLHGRHPLVKGVEGLFYEILTPSLLQSLRPRWQCGALPTTPGSMLFCRSHERLACLIRVLASGFGWVTIELRGLELQEPTSCHHVEAGKIDEAFSAFSETSKPSPFERGHPQRRHEEEDGDQSKEFGDESFVLTPVCEVYATCYERTQLSLTGVLDSPEVLKQLHALFLKLLVAVFSKEIRRQNNTVPDSWLSCPLQSRDAAKVLDQLRTFTWPSAISEELGLGDGIGNKSEDGVGNKFEDGLGTSNKHETSLEERVERPQSHETPSYLSSSDSPAPIVELVSHLDAPTWAEATAALTTTSASPRQSPMPPPGEPPQPSRSFDRAAGRNPPHEPSSRPSVGVVEPCDDNIDALDWLVDLTMSPRTIGRADLPSASAWTDGNNANSSHNQTSHNNNNNSNNNNNNPIRSISTGSSPQLNLNNSANNLSFMASNGSGHSRDRASPIPTVSSWSQGEEVYLNKIPAPKTLAPLDFSGRSKKQAESPASMSEGPSPMISRAVGAPTALEGLTKLGRLVVQAFVAVNIAPSFGQSPEGLGIPHVARIFSDEWRAGAGDEQNWLQRTEEVKSLVLRAFRAAAKVALDQLVCGDDIEALSFEDLEAQLLEIDRDWHLGPEEGAGWRSAMDDRSAQLMALKLSAGTSLAAVRLTLRRDIVRVAELKAEVLESIWASTQLELSYCCNDDDERYSIQAHPSLLRNIVVQSAEYPIFITPPTTVWL